MALMVLVYLAFVSVVLSEDNHGFEYGPVDLLGFYLALFRFYVKLSDLSNSVLLNSKIAKFSF